MRKCTDPSDLKLWSHLTQDAKLIQTNKNQSDTYPQWLSSTISSQLRQYADRLENRGWEALNSSKTKMRFTRRKLVCYLYPGLILYQSDQGHWSLSVKPVNDELK